MNYTPDEVNALLKEGNGILCIACSMASACWTSRSTSPMWSAGTSPTWSLTPSEVEIAEIPAWLIERLQPRPPAAGMVSGNGLILEGHRNLSLFDQAARLARSGVDEGVLRTARP
jgi:hypothetical protein